MAKKSKKNNSKFMIVACKCKRCGRLLTSYDAVQLGYGKSCAIKAGIVPAPKGKSDIVEGQISLFDDYEEEESNVK